MCFEENVLMAIRKHAVLQLRSRVMFFHPQLQYGLTLNINMGKWMEGWVSASWLLVHPHSELQQQGGSQLRLQM